MRRDRTALNARISARSLVAAAVATHQTRETLRSVLETGRRLPFVIAAPILPPALLLHRK